MERKESQELTNTLLSFSCQGFTFHVTYVTDITTRDTAAIDVWVKSSQAQYTTFYFPLHFTCQVDVNAGGYYHQGIPKEQSRWTLDVNFPKFMFKQQMHLFSVLVKNTIVCMFIRRINRKHRPENMRYDLWTVDGLEFWLTNKVSPVC